MPTTSPADEASPATGVLAVACEGRVVRRALIFAVVVGGVLIAINHGDAVLAGSLTRGQLLKMGLTVLVPYVVSTWSSVLAVRSAARVPPQGSRSRSGCGSGPSGPGGSGVTS